MQHSATASEASQNANAGPAFVPKASSALILPDPNYCPAELSPVQKMTHAERAQRILGISPLQTRSQAPGAPSVGGVSLKSQAPAAPTVPPSKKRPVTEEDRERARLIRAQADEIKRARGAQLQPSPDQVPLPATTPASEASTTPLPAERLQQASAEGAKTGPRTMADRERVAAIKQRALAQKAEDAQKAADALKAENVAAPAVSTLLAHLFAFPDSRFLRRLLQRIASALPP
jgi:hypothetical protein